LKGGETLDHCPDSDEQQWLHAFDRFLPLIIKRFSDFTNPFGLAIRRLWPPNVPAEEISKI
jgi:hypothetical protein